MFSDDYIKNSDFVAGQTPERIEFENTDAMSDGEPSLENIIDENEWTDRNFGTGTEDSESDITSTDSSDSGSDEEYEEAMGSPLGAQTLQLATDWIGKQRYSANQFSDEDDDDEFYDSSEGNAVFVPPIKIVKIRLIFLDEGADSQTEGEEMDRARQIRMQEVKLKPLPYLPTDTETEVIQSCLKLASCRYAPTQNVPHLIQFIFFLSTFIVSRSVAFLSSEFNFSLKAGSGCIYECSFCHAASVPSH